MTTHADKIHSWLENIIQHNDQTEIAIAAEHFFKPTLRHFDIDSIEYNSYIGWKINIHQFKDDIRKVISIGYDSERNHWTISGHDILSTRSVDVALNLGVPAQYLDGMADTMNAVVDITKKSDYTNSSLKLDRQRLIELESALRKKERLLTKRVIKCRFVRQAIVDARKRAGKSIGRTLSKLKRQNKRLNEDLLCYHLEHSIKYPNIPAPMCRAKRNDRGDPNIPATPGIYFIWSPDIVYIGQSINMQKRIGGTHDNIQSGDRVSWIEFPVEMLTYAECYYIGLCKPERNCGEPYHYRRLKRKDQSNDPPTETSQAALLPT